MPMKSINFPDPHNISWNTTYAECIINASQQRVWQVLTDFPNYNAWNRFTYDFEMTDFEAGAELTLTVNLASWYQRKQRERIKQVEPPQIIAWSFPYGQNPLLNATRYQILTSREADVTYYQTWETFTGILAPLLKLTFMPMVQRGFDMCAHDLKAYCEATG
jgi:hypothetical protein